MLKKLSDKILYAFLATGLFLSAPAVAHADGNDGFSLGVTGGFSNWEAKGRLNVSGQSATVKDIAPSLGLAARYTVPFGDGMFAGIHAGYQRDWMSKQGNFTPSLAGKAEIDQTLELLARVGLSADGVASYYVAAGPSKAWNRGSLIPGGSTSRRHVGWKAVVGMDFMSFGDGSVTPFAQLEYADHGKKNYGQASVDIKNYGVRLGLMYNF